MVKILIGLVLVLLASFDASAQQKYVRKQVRPDFFIPEKELNRREKLPPFPQNQVMQPEMPKDVATKVEDIEEEMNEEQSTTDDITEAPKKQEVIYTDFRIVPMEEGQKQETAEPFADDLSSSEAYQQKEQAYKKDLESLAKSHKIPENPIVEKDLEKMDSNDKIWVDDNFAK